MTDRTFMGISIQGEYTHGRSYCDQRPLSELTEYFKAAFEKGVKAIAWRQYTPYFNDGEPCEFGVGDWSFTSNEKVAADWAEDEIGHEDDAYDAHGEPIEGYLRTDLYAYEEPWSDRYSHPDGFKKGDIDLPNSSAFEQVLNETFGDHTIVVVTPTKVIQSYYEHD